MKKIIAYHLHEDEERAINEMISEKKLINQKLTPSFAIGDMEEDDITEMEKKGLIVKIIEDVPVAETPGVSANIIGNRLAGLRPGNVLPSIGMITRSPFDETLDALGPQVYLINLIGPLIEDWRKQFEQSNVKLFEYIPENYYKAKLSKSQYNEIKAFDFVKSISLYMPEDAGPIVSPQANLPPAAVGTSTEKGKIKTFDIKLHTGDVEDMKKVQDWLIQNQVSVAGHAAKKIRIYALSDSDLPLRIRALPEVALVEEFIPPHLHNDIARALLGVSNTAGHNPSINFDLKGEDQIIGVADTGLDDGHPDFKGRIAGIVALGRPNNYMDTHGHGTHVCGSILGDGNASGNKFCGIAPMSKLFFQSLLDNDGELGGLPMDLNDLFEEAYQNGVRIHNNSWGAVSQGYYRMNAMEVDEFVARRRDMLVVISAGNEGVAANPVSTQKGFVDCYSLGSPATAKNALTIGASRSSRVDGPWSNYTYGQAWPAVFPDPPISQEKISGNSECIAGFSSRGPTRDSRIKPDVVAPGTDILSTKSSRAPLKNFTGPYAGSPHYAYMSGTSMAAPLVTGCASLIREYYTKIRHHDPSAALLKATIINGTRILSGNDALADLKLIPNYHQGFGCVYMPHSIPNNLFPNLKLEFVDAWQDNNLKFSTTGGKIRYTFEINKSDWLHICLAWTDPPSNAIQNNLNLILEDGNRHNRWIANSSWPFNLNWPDSHNNVQLIRLENPEAGGYIMHIIASNILFKDQDFAVVVVGNLASDLKFEFSNV